MNPLYILLAVIVFLVLILALFVVMLLIVQSRIDPVAYKELQKLKRLLPKQRKNRSWNLLAEQLYPLMRKIPIIQNLLAGIRNRLMTLYADNENLVRAQSASMTMTICSIIIGIWLMALLFTSSWMIRIGIILAAVYMGTVIADLLIGRREKKLLYGLSGLLLDLRHEYHQTHMVIESLERASERTSPLIAAHARKLAEVLASVDPEEELRKYYDEAPNRYTKLLAGISHLILENGDGAWQKGDSAGGERSLYLNALSKINEEIRMDILRRERLDAQLAGIVFVAFSPLFFIEPLRNWGESSFPVMGDYYASRWGMYSLFILYALMGAGFAGLRLVRGLDGARGRAASERGIVRRMLRIPVFNRWADRLSPPDYTAKYFRTWSQIKDANVPISVKELYVNKWLLAICAFLLIMTIQFYMHDAARDRIIYPPQLAASAEPVTTADYHEAQRTEFEGQAVQEALRLELSDAEVLPFMKELAQGKPFLPLGYETDKFVEELVEQVETYRSETYRWHELLVALAAFYIAFSIPNLMLFFRRSMRKWEMQNEADGFTAVVSILSGLPRISVIEILDWMHRYSHIFEPQLLRCLIDYEAGPWTALERLKEEVKFIALERIIDRLQVAAELIPIKKAFDDIEKERSFDLEQRKLQYEGMINRKISIGKMIGFLPLQATFALYLMVPFGYMAIQQLGDLAGVTGGL
ncbi:hypothetical protein PAECIP111893_02766 [Paenibacillus plantiphilus]|uniref:Type II secretion system protein GspF domain-containing protein n=1 Tax=Paenibacillus plantiphilus TaxID=2905650 RepID=A0ABM9CAV1_9BACL|nr:hypothetical protein [Paenibacillus plantiphilus]CAH1207732.1 hypothetical protein PAECIP111893_02766 [Paenibacillus plantiphilus]